ncbi:MAG: 1-deoxy-D-xylulose-5-phosphate reductoisomerase, partial [Thermoleophilia bacterium]|nr:1-deoxy-D-xylulose-5-phosphate reductoisomerase [Thermoleophilia bacterium]
VIEARWLFDVPAERIQVLIHPQSSVHALVEFRDGSVIAQISTTDMRMPIQYALTYPERGEAPVPRYDWSVPHQWTFEPPDLEKFPLLRLAYEALEAGQAASCALNAADEVAVEAFLRRELPFTGIAQVVEETLARAPLRQLHSIADVLEMDQEARRLAGELVAAYKKRGAAKPVLR